MSDDNELALRDETGVADPYEREYMRGAGAVLYRDKVRPPWQLNAIFGGVATMMIAAAIMAPSASVSLAISLPILAIVWLLFSVLRVTVSEGHVNVQLGVFGPKIPVAAIESAEPLEYDWKQFGGWGIRMNLRGETMYNLPGDGGRAVKIVWRNRKGKRKVTYVASRHSKRLAASIDRARAALPAGKTTAELPPG